MEFGLHKSKSTSEPRPTLHTRALGSAVLSLGLAGAGLAAAAPPAAASIPHTYCSGAHFASSRCWGFWVVPGYNSRWTNNYGYNSGKTACVQADYRPPGGASHYGPYVCKGRGGTASSHPYTRYSDQSTRPLCWNGAGVGSELVWLTCVADWESGG